MSKSRVNPPSLRLLSLAGVLAVWGVSGCYTGVDPDYGSGFGDEGDTYGDDDDDDDGGESGESGDSGGGNETTGGGGETTGGGGETTGGGGETTGGGGEETTGGGGETTGGGGETTGGGGEETGGETTGGGGEETTGGGGGEETTGGGGGESTTTGNNMGGDMPNNSYCNPVDDWDPAWVAWELEVIELVNQARAQGGNCGSEGSFGPSGPLTWEPALTCASRVHSDDMGDQGYFSHDNLQGQGPGWRLDQAGYSGNTWGENIAAGYGSPQQAVQGWLDSDGHCANMLNGNFSETGVGYANVPGSPYGHYWTQTFGG